LNRTNQPLTRFGIHRLVSQYAERASRTMPSMATKRISPHTIRHTTAVHLLRAGVDINTIRAWLGHVSLDATHVYAEVDMEMKAKALARVDISDLPEKSSTPSSTTTPVRRPQTAQGSQMARRSSALDVPFHADIGLLAQRRGGLLFRHHTPAKSDAEPSIRVYVAKRRRIAKYLLLFRELGAMQPKLGAMQPKWCSDHLLACSVYIDLA
jgi:hypothetical protein